jgi:hypothetical protein
MPYVPRKRIGMGDVCNSSDADFNMNACLSSLPEKGLTTSQLAILNLPQGSAPSSGGQTFTQWLNANSTAVMLGGAGLFLVAMLMRR